MLKFGRAGSIVHILTGLDSFKYHAVGEHTKCVGYGALCEHHGWIEDLQKIL
jgi:hypothetical protein